MESFLRWWRGGSRGERRTINTTPLPQRYELYHRKRRNEGVSLIAACCIAFNLVMGSGFLALPAAVAAARGNQELPRIETGVPPATV